MALSYNLGFNPFWYMVDVYGEPLSGGGFYAGSSLNPTVPKTVYQNASGTLAWPTNTIVIPGGGTVNNIILFDANGTQGPFYFLLDSANPSDLYYIQFYDKDGNPLNTINAYEPGSGGGGGTITTNYFIKNYVTNNLFLHNNADTTTGIVTATSGTVICPSNHSGYKTPDVVFLKDGSGATDVLKIYNPGLAGSDFALGTDPLTGDVTPEFYMRFSTTGGSGETQKCFQWPLDLHLKNLEQQDITVLVWAKGNSGTQTISPFIWQDTGSGGSPTVITPVNIDVTPRSLSASWAPYEFSYTVPSLTGITLGTCGDDATYLQIGMPLNTTGDISFTKPKVYLGTQTGFAELQTYDDVDSVAMSPRTGDIRVSLNKFAPYGWVLMNDTTIGSGGSGATSRANVDTWPLYMTLYLNVSDTYAPVTGGRTAPGNTFAAAVTDFTANKPIALTKQLGRVLASGGTPSSGTNTGTVWVPGQTTGNEVHTVGLNEIPDHQHAATPNGQYVTVGPGAAGSGGGANFTSSGVTGGVSSYGGQTALNLQNPVAYFNVFIKL